MAAPTTPPLTAEILDGPVPVIRVRGELDLSTAGRLCRTVGAVAGVRRRMRVVLDLSELAFCDSTGLRALVGAVREVEINGGRAALVAPPGGKLARLLDLSGLGEFLRVAPSRDLALKRLS
ncbi:STAS domain-containing protein [Solirubrobacter sp. CPCC 204708]|uniref:Anti-sigma factor antagonist n=1 Tax=Solirubrobacter deserti TaxID=2282478 RepID=A0ABT4RE33_9ACTN|nr:STAS domain-containing protein [Solirubrobacter deserti]MBE2316044.1 STAS domain-containing protein [Solirubrobacter deserti]MDA0136796.1 STAS domain-containing protein [Solirubrobacter deserti]